ncbi:MAG TPA: cell division protein CrgA [Nocardioidaceae bacterium]|nr:cell division protein CrgA [Nocardioidaceae bacterium]
MPESRQRKKADFTPPVTTRRPVRVGTRRWVAPIMVTLWLVGLAWIVVYYIVPGLPYLREIGNWNLAVGMVLIAAGFVFATRWE